MVHFSLARAGAACCPPRSWLCRAVSGRRARPPIETWKTRNWRQNSSALMLRPWHLHCPLVVNWWTLMRFGATRWGVVELNKQTSSWSLVTGFSPGLSPGLVPTGCRTPDSSPSPRRRRGPGASAPTSPCRTAASSRPAPTAGSQDGSADGGCSDCCRAWRSTKDRKATNSSTAVFKKTPQPAKDGAPYPLPGLVFEERSYDSVERVDVPRLVDKMDSSKPGGKTVLRGDEGKTNISHID